MIYATRMATLAAALAAVLAVPLETHAQVADANVRIRAVIEGIDRPNRILTLRGPEGNLSQYQVSEEVQDFNNLREGNTIVVTFRQALALQLRAPGAPEPDRTQLSAPPGVTTEARTLSAVVYGIDGSVPSITLRGPQGEWATLRVPESISLEDIELGDTIDVTYALPLAVEVSTR